MARQLFLEGFVVRPLGYALDIENGEIEAVGMGEQKMKLADLAVFATETWPKMWEALKTQMAESDAAKEAETPKPNRAVRRATKLKGVS